MWTWYGVGARRPEVMERMKSSGDSNEEAQENWSDEGEIWNQLGHWAGVACIVVGVSQAGRQKKGPACECVFIYTQGSQK